MDLTTRRSVLERQLAQVDRALANCARDKLDEVRYSSRWWHLMRAIDELLDHRLALTNAIRYRRTLRLAWGLASPEFSR